MASAEPGEVTFLGNSRYAPLLASSRASAVLVTEEFADKTGAAAAVVVANPTIAFSAVISHFGLATQKPAPSVHPSAVISTSVALDRSTVFVGPLAIIEDGVQIGEGSAIHAGAYIGPGAVLGKNCVIHANATIKERCVLGDRVIVHSGAVIGSDGFGYEFLDGQHTKIEQVGIVEIGDDVEIGSCTTIDRARFGKTLIGKGTKIDNLVQLAHNVVTGQHCILVSQVGISGSTRLGNYVVIGGQVGVAGHLDICDKASIMAKSGVTKDLVKPGYYTGYPAKPLMEGRRLLVAPASVPKLQNRVRTLEKRLAELEKRLAPEE